jgi:hypothetical protein
MPARLKQGFAFAKSIFKNALRNTQVKIGGKSYYRLAEQASRSGFKGDIKKFRLNKAFSVHLPKLYERRNVNSIRSLVQNNYKFNENDRRVSLQILQASMRKNNGYRAFQFKYRGEDNYEDKLLTLRDNKLEQFVDILSAGGIINDIPAVGSDTLNQLAVNEIEDFRIVNVEKPLAKRIINKTGKFFRYLNTTKIELERYQIITEQTDIKLLDEHCLIYALKQYNIKPSLLNNIKTTFENGSYFAKKNLKKVSDIIKKTIILKSFDGYKIQTAKFGKHEETIQLGLYQEHYFINEVTKYSLYSSLHYDEVKEKKDFHNIYRHDGRKHLYSDTQRKAYSINLIKNLLETNNFIKDHPILKQRDEYQRVSDKTETLDTIADEQELYEFKPKERKNNLSVFYADTETDTHGNHKPILIGVIKDTDKAQLNDVNIFTNNDDSNNFFIKFMEYVHKNSKTDGQIDDVVIYFHNLKYDYHVLLPYIKHSTSPCERDGQYYNCKILYKKRIFELRDSYKLASFPLSKFQKTFQLDKEYDKKEAIAYNYYSIKNMKKYLIPVADYESYLKEDEKKIFKATLDEHWGIMEYQQNKKGVWIFNPIAYYKHYLKYDVYVLFLGIKTFKKTIDRITDNKLNLYDYLTISSLTYALMGNEGAFDGIYRVSGNLREFISKAITGGRVQTNKKYEKQIIERKIADYDGVSLYPSAISRCCRERGLPKGKCKQIKTFDKKELDKFSYYIVKVRITKINKYQDLPMVSYKDDEGILQYTNVIDDPIISYIDMITLEDWIEFQQIEYEILDGVYWNDGYNKKMGEIIEHLFNERLKQKKQGNEALQQVLKLMMNSSYGKTITKKSMTDKIIIDAKYKDKYFYNNFRNIKEQTPLYNGDYLFKIDKVDTSYNEAHIGVIILSYSKRIMNEVFNVANDNNCPLYYTDTDSIHCNYDDVKTIETEFKERYQRELTGKQIGQFHIDFDLHGAQSEIYATKSIFLGKKSYIDCLESTDKKGNKISGYHFRMKGVTVSGLDHCSKTFFNNNLFSLYTHLSKGNEQDIVLNPIGYKVMFEYDEHQIFTRGDGSFTRTVKF